MDWDSRIIPFAKASKTQILVRSNLASALGKNNLSLYKHGFVFRMLEEVWGVKILMLFKEITSTQCVFQSIR